VIPLLRMRKIAFIVAALALFVASPAAAKVGPTDQLPKPAHGFADGYKKFGPPPGKGFADGN
jgi:hypothetical protein